VKEGYLLPDPSPFWKKVSFFHEENFLLLIFFSPEVQNSIDIWCVPLRLVGGDRTHRGELCGRC